MSWGSRFGNWAPSRWSPFTSRGDPANSRITDSDFSYITSDDLARHVDDNARHHQPRRSSNLSSGRAAQEEDVILFRHQKISYPVHFPPASIDNDLTVGDVRAEAARTLKVSDSRRIRMFYKGRNLKDNNQLLRDNGLQSDAASEILCVIGEPISDARQRRDSDEEDDDDDVDEDDDDGVDSGANARSPTIASEGTKKKKRRSRKKKKAPSAATTPAAASTPTVEHLPVPSGAHPTHRSVSPSRGSTGPPSTSTSRPQTPLTPQAKLAAIADKFHTELVPTCQAFLDNPPADKPKREFEHKKLSETILAQVLLKLDAVETEGDEGARATRKALVKEVQGWLNKLDAVLN